MIHSIHIFQPWDIRDAASLTPGCSGGRRAQRSGDWRKQRDKTKAIAKKSRRLNRGK